MGFNTFPCNPYPISTEELHKGDNEELQAQIDAIKDGSEIDSFGDVETALGVVTEAITGLGTSKAAKADIAPTFSAEGTYAVGDLVYYEGVLYKCTTAHEEAAWDAEDFTVTSVVEEVCAINSNLTSYEKQNNLNLEVPNRKNLIDSSAFSNGYFTSEGVFTENQYYYATDYIKVEPNTDYVVSGFTGGGAYFVYYDASKTVLSTVVDTATTFKTPSNAAFIRLSIQRQGLTNAQMELGTTATEYTPYIPSVETRLKALEAAVFNN